MQKESLPEDAVVAVQAKRSDQMPTSKLLNQCFVAYNVLKIPLPGPKYSQLALVAKHVGGEVFCKRYGDHYCISVTNQISRPLWVDRKM